MNYSNVYIESIGYELAPNVVDSSDLEARLAPVYAKLHFQPGQLEALTGIRERRYWDAGFRMSNGAIAAGRKALAQTPVAPGQIGMLIYAGVCRDNLEPATACAVANALQIGPDALLYDVSNACLGVVNGMIQIANAIETGQISAGMVVSVNLPARSSIQPSTACWPRPTWRCLKKPLQHSPADQVQWPCS